jgi:hypothetical protein
MTIVGIREEVAMYILGRSFSSTPYRQNRHTLNEVYTTESDLPGAGQPFVCRTLSKLAHSALNGPSGSHFLPPCFPV